MSYVIPDGSRQRRWEIKQSNPLKVAVVIPCYRENRHILKVIEAIGKPVEMIFVIDDGCPDNTGHWVREHCKDTRVRVVFHTENSGVGSAMITGWSTAFACGADIAVKIDGDGQMNAAEIGDIIAPLLQGNSDYCKGNRFLPGGRATAMPLTRKIGNKLMSWASRISSGYWHISDSTNGFLAIHRDTFYSIQFKKLSKGYFFEMDLLCRLGEVKARITEVPTTTIYADEVSCLNPWVQIWVFSYLHFHRFVYRMSIRLSEQLRRPSIPMRHQSWNSN